MRHVTFIFALLLVVATAKAVPPPRLAKGPAPVPVPNIALAKQPFLIPPRNGMPGTVTIPSKNPRRGIMEEHLLTRSGETFRGKFLGYDPAEGLKWSHPDFLPKVIHFLPNR
ncbi:MAG: hypothetical protein P8J63_03655, partial [Verrucomicrobiota bacterium]|nr:hypothetical protein [Verrucomicrobiota bacterium]